MNNFYNLKYTWYRFQDLSVWKEKYDKLGDVVSFLVATCEPSVAEQLKNQFLQISTNWDHLFPQIQHYMNAGRILQFRNQFKLGLQQLQTWLRNAEQLLANKRLGSVENIKQYAQKIQVSQKVLRVFGKGPSKRVSF